MTAAFDHPKFGPVARTPDERFANLPAWTYAPHYIDDLAGFEGLRLHYIDEGPQDEHDGVDLDPGYAKETLKNLQSIWRRRRSMRGSRLSGNDSATGLPSASPALRSQARCRPKCCAAR